MTTLAEAVLIAVDELRQARLALAAFNASVAAQLTAKLTQAQAAIANFYARPPVRQVFVDPVNGDDTKDGSTIANARKNIDTVLADMGSNPTTILLLGNATIRKRTTMYSPYTITGIQVTNDAAGFAPFRRVITFLGTAENSPIPLTGTVCSGVFLNGVAMRTTSIDFYVPDRVAANDYQSHITAVIDAPVSLSAPNITVWGPNAGYLLGAYQSRMSATIDAPTLAANAPGHVFAGVAAGANPNAQYAYTSNMTAA